MTTQKQSVDPVFAEKPEKTDIELDEIYPDRDVEDVKEKEKERYETGDWE